MSSSSAQEQSDFLQQKSYRVALQEIFYQETSVADSVPSISDIICPFRKVIKLMENAFSFFIKRS